MVPSKGLTVAEMASLGGKARARKLSKQQLAESAKKAADARWAKARKEIKQDIKRAEEINLDLHKLAKTATKKARRAK